MAACIVRSKGRMTGEASPLGRDLSSRYLLSPSCCTPNWLATSPSLLPHTHSIPFSLQSRLRGVQFVTMIAIEYGDLTCPLLSLVLGASSVEMIGGRGAGEVGASLWSDLGWVRVA